MWHDLQTELELLRLLQQPNPVKALTDYLAAVTRLRGGTKAVKFLPRNGRTETGGEAKDSEAERQHDDLTFPPPEALAEEQPVEAPKAEAPPKRKRARKAKAA